MLKEVLVRVLMLKNFLSSFLVIMCVVILTPSLYGNRVEEEVSSPSTLSFRGYSRRIDFWGEEKKPKLPEKTESEISDIPISKQMQELLENPTEENAREYLKAQEEQLAKIYRAYQMILKVQQNKDNRFQKIAEIILKRLPQESSRYILLYFKNKNCPFCKIQEKEIDRFQEEFPEVAVYEVNPVSILFRELGINSTPSFVLFDKKESFIDMFSGFTKAEMLCEKFREIKK